MSDTTLPVFPLPGTGARGLNVASQSYASHCLKVYQNDPLKSSLTRPFSLDTFLSKEE